MNCQPTNDSLARAVEYLGAVEVAPGRYAVPMGDLERPVCYRIASAEQLATRQAGDNCADWPKMPSWWSPKRRFAWRHPGKQCGAGNASCPHREAYCFPYSQRVTASLETGEEVQA